MPNGLTPLLLVILVGCLDGCGGPAVLEPDQTEPADAGFSSVFHAADPLAARQLIEGFYSPEEFGRWTKPKFSLYLRVPSATKLSQPALVVKLFIPDVEIGRLKSMTLSAAVNGVALGPETFTSAGRQVYARSIPPAALAKDPARVEFALDKWLPAGGQEGRELGIAVTFAGLTDSTLPEP